MPHPDLDRFEQLYRLADRRIADASNHDLAEAARILATNLAQYQSKYGELPPPDYISLAAADDLTPELASTLADGMETLVGVLAHLSGYADPDAETH